MVLFLDSYVLYFISGSFILIGSITIIVYIFGYIKFLFTKKRVQGMGIIDDIKKRIERNEEKADIMFMLSLQMVAVFGLIIAIAFWIEKLIRLIFP